MQFVKLGLVATVGFLLLASIPVAGATTPANGVVTTCTAYWSCNFGFNTSAGQGWANSTGYRAGGSIDLKLPGEAKTSTGLSYLTNAPKVTTKGANSTYWTIGNFIGTDVNTGKIVYGTTDSNYTATCHIVFRWCHNTYTTNNGTIVVLFTRAEATSTVLSCSPSTLHPQQKANCTATVSDLWNASNYPTGKLHLSSPSGYGSFSNKGVCTLVSGKCQFYYRTSDNACGAGTLGASYPGNLAFYKSSGSFQLDVYVNGGC